MRFAVCGTGVRLTLSSPPCDLPVYLENRYTMALVEYLPGKATKDTPPTAAGHGEPAAERFVTQKLDINSLQRSPNWMDPHTVRSAPAVGTVGTVSTGCNYICTYIHTTPTP